MAFLPRRPLFDELQEHAPRGAAPRAVFGKHAATRLTRERVREEGGTALRPHRPQDLAQQRDFGFLENRGELLHRECVHEGSSVTGDQCWQSAMMMKML